VENTIGPCGGPTQHRVTLQNHLVDSGQTYVHNFISGGNSACWNSNTQTGACTSDTQWYLVSSSLTQNGPCTERAFRAVSLGAP
jgi:hypothetical protein